MDYSSLPFSDLKTDCIVPFALNNESRPFTLRRLRWISRPREKCAIGQVQHLSPILSRTAFAPPSESRNRSASRRQRSAASSGPCCIQPRLGTIDSSEIESRRGALFIARNSGPETRVLPTRSEKDRPYAAAATCSYREVLRLRNASRTCAAFS